MRSVTVSVIVTGERAGQLLANFFPVPEVFAKVNVAQFPSPF